MIQLTQGGAYLVNGTDIVADTSEAARQIQAKTGITISREEAAKNTMAYGILREHNTSGNMDKLKIRFDKLTSHDITFVGIIQTARASGLQKFPMPYVLTNCHNSLCAVGGTINEDDHMFGLTCAKKYGGVYVPPHQAVIHQFAREMLTGGGKMILGSDSHTRYGALGTMAMGEGGPELVKQLLNQTYDINMPGVVAVYLKGAPVKGVGPQDVALAIIGAVFKNGYVKNKVMEFVGPGVASLSADFRIGIDVMTTETTCLSSIWKTDDQIREFYEIHGRTEEYKELNPGQVTYYDGLIEVDLDKIRPMIAMPFHPSNTYTIEELNAHPEKYRDKWVFFQGYMENTSLRIIQNTHTPTLVDRKINPDIQYAVILDVTNMEAFEQETAIRAYIKGYGTEAVVQTKAYFTWEYLEYFQKEIACIKVEEMRLTEWVEDAS